MAKAIIMLNAFMLNALMLSLIMLNVVFTECRGAALGLVPTLLENVRLV
jgi:hypothetical protein